MSDPASSGYVGRSVLRREDRRLLTGRGVFVADLALPGMLPAALAPGAPLVHPDLGTNVISEYEIGKGDVEMAFRHAPMTLKRRLYHHRYTGVPMECRGVVADYDSRTDGLTIWASTQVVHSVR